MTKKALLLTPASKILRTLASSLAVCLLAVTSMNIKNAPAAEKINTEQARPLPRVLLIGDSISGGYQKNVKKLLAGKANVVKNKGNGQHTWNGIEKLDEWIGDGKWDVIHFNWGLWDIAHRHPESKNFGRLDKVNGKITTTLADYEKNLRTLVARLKKTGATLIWASTTPVPEGEPGRIKGDEIKYNALAAKIMAENNITIDDLHTEAVRLGHPKTNNVHDTGNLSGKVADSILAALPMTLQVLPLNMAPPKPYGVLPSKEQLQWHELEQYAFCHFTINTFTDKEWGYGDEDPALFNPSDCDPGQIVGAARAAGMKGFILTCKHHDGFCLWPTKTTTHNISKSPYRKGKGDLVKEFSEAAHRHGLKFGVYLSPWDRNSKHYGRPAYIRQQRAQLTELLTLYGPVFEVWFDGANGGDGYYGGNREIRKVNRLTYYDWPTTWSLAKRLQPNAVLMSDIGPGVRWIGNEHGRANYPCWATYTPKGRNGNPPGIGECEYQIGQTGTPDGQSWIPGECDVSIRPGWFYHQNQDHRVKTPRELLDLYFASVGHGASFLLNLPPDRRGKLHENDVNSLTAYGKILTQLFSVNYAQDAKTTASIVREATDGENFSANNVLNGDRYSYWATPDGTKQATLTLKLKGTKTFDVIRLREPIQMGQRIRKFNIEVHVNGQWQPWIVNGSSIGAHTLFRKPPVSADGVRIHITQCAACPLLSEVSLFKLPTEIPNSIPTRRP